MSPLEIGLHALKAVPLEKGGRGKKGGLSEYAGKIGQKAPNVTIYRQAAEVFAATKNHYADITVFLDKAQHLAAIHKTATATSTRMRPALPGRVFIRERLHRILGHPGAFGGAHYQTGGA